MQIFNYTLENVKSMQEKSSKKIKHSYLKYLIIIIEHIKLI